MKTSTIVTIAGCVVGATGVGAGIAGVAYAKKSEKKCAEVCKRINYGIDEVLNNKYTDIPERLVQESIDKHAEEVVTDMVDRIGKKIHKSAKEDICAGANKVLEEEREKISSRIAATLDDEFNADGFSDSVKKNVEAKVADKMIRKYESIVNDACKKTVKRYQEFLNTIKPVTTSNSTSDIIIKF